MVQIHGSIEERKKQKYYCEICDVVFISKLFMDKHNSGKKHNNMLKSIQYVNDIKKIIADDNKISNTVNENEYDVILDDLYLEPILNFEDLISDCTAEIYKGKKLLKHFESAKNSYQNTNLDNFGDLLDETNKIDN